MIIGADYSGKTRQSLSLWNEKKNKLGVIKQIFIWKYEEDAILKGYYETEKVQGAQLEKIKNVPNMVIIDEYGDEIRLDGCNCGYGGEGPSGSIRILKDNGLVDIDALVKGNDIINIDLSGSEPIFHSEQSTFNSFVRGSINQADIYKQGQNLIFAEDDRYDGDPVEFLQYYLPRVINNVDSVTIFANESDAQSKGKLIPKRDYGGIYQVVVKGKNGKEIWLPASIREDERFEEQETVQQILEVMEFPKLGRNQTLIDKIRKAIGSYEEKSITLTVDSGEIAIFPAI